MMITTVTLNASIDKIYRLPHFQVGTVSRVGDVHAAPGGKGINVAKVLHQLGEQVLATGFIGGMNGQYIKQALEQRQINCDFSEVEGESRICLNIIDEKEQTTTELLEPGPVVLAVDLESLKQKVRQAAQKSKLICMSGSVPQGVPDDIYNELIELAHAEGAKVLLDTSGGTLLAGIKAKPFLIKPNEDEIEAIIGKKLTDERELYAPIQELLHSGIACVVVSLGARGSIVGYKDQLFRVTAPQVKAVNTVGCGDAFVAGMASAIYNNKPLNEAIRLATASGTANAITTEAGSVRVEDVQKFIPQIGMERIDEA